MLDRTINTVIGSSNIHSNQVKGIPLIVTLSKILHLRKKQMDKIGKHMQHCSINPWREIKFLLTKTLSLLRGRLVTSLQKVKNRDNQLTIVVKFYSITQSERIASCIVISGMRYFYLNKVKYVLFGFRYQDS